MKVLIAESDTNKRNELVALFKEHVWAIEEAPDDISEWDPDGLKDGGFNAVIGDLSNHFTQQAGVIAANDIGNSDVFSAQFAKANNHPTSHIGILVCTQGDNVLSLDMLNKSVKLNDEDICLTPAEYKILRILMLNANEMTPKATIAARAEIEESAYSVHLTYIRKRILPFTIQADHTNGYALSSCTHTQKTRGSNHGITTYKDGRITYKNGDNEIEIKPKFGKNMLRDLLTGKRKKAEDSNKVFMSHIRRYLADASRCATAPHGYDFFDAKDGYYHWRETPKAITPKPEPKGMFFSLGDGKLIVDTHNMVLRNKDTGDKEKLATQQARFLEALAECPADQGITMKTFAEQHKIPSAHTKLTEIRTKIKKLDLPPHNYFQTGQQSDQNSTGYQAINATDLSHLLDREQEPAQPHTPAPAAE